MSIGQTGAAHRVKEYLFREPDHRKGNALWMLAGCVLVAYVVLSEWDRGPFFPPYAYGGLSAGIAIILGTIAEFLPRERRILVCFLRVAAWALFVAIQICVVMVLLVTGSVTSW